MRYKDKSSNITVVLTESATDFLILTEVGDAETVAPVLINQRHFTVTPSTNNDGVFLFQSRSDQESRVEIDKTLTRLKSDDRIKDIVPALVDNSGNVRFALPGRITVRFRNTNESAVKKYLLSIQSKIVRNFGSDLYEISIPDGVELFDFIETLNENPAIIFAEPSYYGFNDQEIDIRFATNYPQIRFNVKTPENPDEDENETDSDQFLLWNLNKLQMSDAWKITTGHKDIIIAVLDGMPDTAHEAVANKFFVPMSNELSFADDDSISSHATQISSIIAAESNKLLGVAPGIRLLPLIINLNSQVYAQRSAAILKAAEFARNKKIGDLSFSRMILSCSWRTRGDIASIRTALEEAVESNVLVVFSAGNSGTNESHFPSDYSVRPGVLEGGLIAVAATDTHDTKATYSNFSASIDLCAPGGDGLPLDDGDIFCADLDGGYAFGAGTSLAVPHVAAVAALMLSLNSALTPNQLKQILKETADDIGSLNPDVQPFIGSGRINALKALVAVNGISGNESTDISLVTEKLKQYSRALEDATGWSISTAEVFKGEDITTINLQ